jgi:glycosyltransferase involved in cell wall biosynthesis
MLVASHGAPAAKLTFTDSQQQAETLPAVLQVGLDVSPLALTRAGTARYLRSLLAALEDEEVDVRRYELAGSGRARKLWRDSAWYLSSLPRAAAGDGVDVLHCPTQRAPIRSRVPLVVTIHDVAVLQHPETFNLWTRRYSAFALPRVVHAARRVIVGSDFSRREVAELLDVPDEKLRVIPYGVSGLFMAPNRSAAAGDYVLAVSTLEPRKNLARLVEGFRRAELNGLELRVVGAEGWGGVEVRGDNVRWLGEIPDGELARQYRGAAAVAYVSLYEGFGLPVLEAMASGAPVVAPAEPPFSEYAEGIAVGVDPRDPDSIAAGLREAVERGPELGPRGRERAHAFTWRRAAQAHVEVYREAAA